MQIGDILDEAQTPNPLSHTNMKRRSYKPYLRGDLFVVRLDDGQVHQQLNQDKGGIQDDETDHGDLARDNGGSVQQQSDREGGTGCTLIGRQMETCFPQVGLR